mgnify:CR=1 FL=1
MKKNTGFTLAEVLITLGIIGVVAAMTIPMLITNYQKKQVAAQLKESYSIFQQAVKLSEDDNGGFDSWDTTLTGKAFFEKYMQNYVKSMNVYSTSELNKLAPRKILNGSNYTGTTYNGRNSCHFTLINGSMITINLNSAVDNGMWVGIDVNGLSKPNRIGRDTFLFFLSPQYGLRPLGDLGTPASWSFGPYKRSTVMGARGNACAKGKTGYWCSALIMQDGWTIEDDYPWNGK